VSAIAPGPEGTPSRLRLELRDMDIWLREVRKRTNVVLHEEVLR
jgi:hypothetical protein